ncbi:Retrovirus-related Pol polyprotein from transposon 17.6, partial [Mucuna pruriens]
MTFKTKFGLYEWLVMPFGLTNTPSTFIRLMNHVLRSLIGKCVVNIGKCVVVYFHDILVYSTCLDDHLLLVKSVLEILRKKTLFPNLGKCVFCSHEVTFLNFVVGSHGVKVDEEKMANTYNHVGSKKLPCVCKFYKRFVKDFNTIAAPLNEIMKKNLDLNWRRAKREVSKLSRKGSLKLQFLLCLIFQNLLSWIVCSCDGLETCQHYLVPKKFVIHSDHEALKNLRGKGCLGLDYIKELYDKDLYFSEPFDMFIHSAFHDFLRHDGFLFKGKKQYVLMSSTWQLLMNKVHKDGLMGHFGELKTFKILNDDFY